MSRRFEIGDRDFLLDGQPFRVLSGALHYFRSHPDQWADRIHKARLMGLNTIETYVPWNAHQPSPEEWVWDGGLDLRRFLEAIAAEGMYAIVRPGPYICAEWANGGLPPWLFAAGGVGIRRHEARYLEAVGSFLSHVYAIVAPLQVDRDGPVILLQIENEYGAYGDDADYLRWLADHARAAGITVPFITVDQPEAAMVEAGSLPELHRTGSFGSRSAERLATLRSHQPTGPLMATEYWCGWFDHWGAEHHTAAADEQASDLATLLEMGASVNLYMVHGGTNFGFTNGANDKGTYEPTVTSYDYHAPLDEAGRPTAKYWAFREVLGRYADLPDEVPGQGEPAPTPPVRQCGAREFWRGAQASASWQVHRTAPTMDEVGLFAGFMAYETQTEGGMLTLTEVRDRAHVWVDDELIAILERRAHDRSVEIPAGRLRVLVEDQGRVNYGERLGEPVGLIGPVKLDGRPVMNWRILPLPFQVPPDVPDGDTTPAGARWVRGAFQLEEPADLFVDATGLGHGAIWVNRFNLGRFWNIGPQRTLYLPAPVTRTGENTLVVLELEPREATLPSFAPDLQLG